MSLSNADVHAFTSALKGVVMEGVEAALPSSSSAAPVGRVMKLLLLHLRFACGVAGDRDIPTIWEAVDRRKASTEGLATLNKKFMRGLPYCCRVFGGREYLSTPPPLLEFVKKVLLWNPYLDLYLSRGGIHSMAHAPANG